MSNLNSSIPPLPADDENEPDTVEVDGEQVLDPDANEDDVDSAAADRVAAEKGEDPEEPE